MSNRREGRADIECASQGLAASTRAGATETSSVGGAFWGGAAVVVALTVAAFLPILPNDFVDWDDLGNFLQNPNYRGLHWANLRWMFTTAHLGHYIPVAWLSLGLDYILWGMNPWGYHLTSLILHAANALLFYLLAYRLLKLGFGSAPPHGHLLSSAGVERDTVNPAPVPNVGTGEADHGESRTGDGALTLGALIAALVFSIHPLRVESVAWITERRDLLAGVFSLLTVLVYVRACGRGQAGRLHTGLYWSVVGLFALALMSKSIVVGLPLVLFVLDFYPLRRISLAWPGWRGRLARLVLEQAPLLLLSAAIGTVMLLIANRRGALTPLETLTAGERLAISGYSLAFYLWKSVMPWPLSPFYELHYPIVPLAARYLVPGAAVLAVTAGVIFVARRWPGVLIAWVSYIILLLPVVGILHNGGQIVADRYSYLACLPLALLVGAGVAWCWRAQRAGAVTARVARLVVALSGTAIAALAAMTPLQARVWRDSETVWRHVVAVDPHSAFGHFNLGGTLAYFGRPGEARAEYEQALELLPDRLQADHKPSFQAALGAMLYRMGDVAEGQRQLQEAVRLERKRLGRSVPIPSAQPPPP